MRRLYDNIEKIHIKGGVNQLSDVVKAMDIALQNIAEVTCRMVDILAKYSATNKGAQYNKVVRTALVLRDRMFDASMQLNDMQRQVVTYQNKIYKYEDMNIRASNPNPFLVNKRQINVDIRNVQFDKNEMIKLAALLTNYGQTVFYNIKLINQKKNSIATVWIDEQYKMFATFIDEITRNIVESKNIFDEYVNYLEDKIKEL